MAHRGHIGKTFSRIAAVVLCLSGMLSAEAATKVWNDGGGATTNWSTTTDWVGGVAPVGGDSLVFQGTLGLTNNNNLTASTSFAGITFSNNAGAFLLAGNAITLTGNIVNNSTSTETINLAISLSSTINLNAASGNLTLGGALSGAGGATLTGSGVVTLNGASANTYSGMTTVNAGELDLAKTAGTPVLYTTADLPVEVTKPILTVTEPEVVQLAQAPVMAVKPTGESVEIATVVTPPPALELKPDLAPAPVAVAAVHMSIIGKNQGH